MLVNVPDGWVVVPKEPTKEMMDGPYVNAYFREVWASAIEKAPTPPDEMITSDMLESQMWQLIDNLAMGLSQAATVNPRLWDYLVAYKPKTVDLGPNPMEHRSPTTEERFKELVERLNYVEDRLAQINHTTNRCG